MMKIGTIPSMLLKEIFGAMVRSSLFLVAYRIIMKDFNLPEFDELDLVAFFNCVYYMLPWTWRKA